MQHGFSHDLKTRFAQGGTGFHHIGDGIGNAQTDGNFNSTVKFDDGAAHAHLSKFAAQKFRITCCNAFAVKFFGIFDRTLGGGEAETGFADGKGEKFAYLCAAVGGKVASGDTGINDAFTDVKGDVAGTEKDKFDVVIIVFYDQFPAASATAVSGGEKKFDSAFRECAFIGNGNFKRGIFVHYKYL